MCDCVECVYVYEMLAWTILIYFKIRSRETITPFSFENDTR